MDEKYLDIPRSGFSAKKANHPAPFPIELPKRIIHMYSYDGDIVRTTRSNALSLANFESGITCSGIIFPLNASSRRDRSYCNELRKCSINFQREEEKLLK